jgi:Cadherin-like
MKSMPVVKPFVCAILWLLPSKMMSFQQLNDVIEYRVLEQQPASSLIGNVLLDTRLHTMYPAQTLINFRLQLMSVTSASGSAAVASDAKDYFVLDPVTGLLRTSKILDREQLCRPMSNVCSVQLDVSLTPVRYFRVFRVIVHVDDINDNSPTFYPSTLDLSVYELATTGARFPLPVAVDPDSAPFSVYEYQLTSSSSISGQLPFRLSAPNASTSGLRWDDPRGASDDVVEVYLVLVSRLDREIQSAFNLTVTARDGGVPSRTGAILAKFILIPFSL